MLLSESTKALRRPLAPVSQCRQQPVQLLHRGMRAARIARGLCSCSPAARHSQQLVAHQPEV